MEDISQYIFDFDNEVNELFRYLDSKADNIAFVDVGVKLVPYADSIVSLRHLAGKQLKDSNLLIQKLEEVRKQYVKSPFFSSWRAPITDPDDPDETVIGHAVCLRQDEEMTAFLSPKSKDLLRLFTLYRETGHALMPEGETVDEDHPFRECAADAYAAIRFFQRFGRKAAPLLSMISWQRANSALHGITSHLTTPILDKIIADSAHRDFSKLTHDETIELVSNYARDWTPEASVLSEARNSFGHCLSPLTGLFSDTCLSSTSSDLAFYLGAKVALPLMELSEITYRKKPWQFTNEEKKEYKEAIQSRAANMDLRYIFGSTVPRTTKALPVMKTMKVSLPRGLKKFTVNQF